MKIIVKSTKDNTETVSWKYSLVKPVYSDFFFFAQSPITQHAMAASTLHPVWLLRCHPTNQAAFPPSMRIQHGLGNWKNVYPLFCVFFFFLICGFVSQRGGRRKKKTTNRNRITSNVQCSPAAVAFINANALSRGAWHKLTMKHMHSQPQTRNRKHTHTRASTHTAGGWRCAHQCHCCRAPRCTNRSGSADDGRKRMLT